MKEIASKMMLDNIPIELTRKSVKYINLRINREGRVLISAPMRCPDVLIQLFLSSKKSWIFQHVNRLKQKPKHKTKQFVSGEKHYYLGQCYTLQVIPNSLNDKIDMCDTKIMLKHKSSTTVTQRQALLEHWYRAQFKALLPKLIAKWEPIIGVVVKEWGIKSMKTRWGSCNPSKQRIWLALALMKQPIQCIEYVVVHEMVHILEASHNKRFHALMTLYLPEWKMNKTLLDETK